MAEWSIALDLKSSEPKGSVGSNPTLSVVSDFTHFVFDDHLTILADRIVKLKPTPPSHQRDRTPGFDRAVCWMSGIETAPATRKIPGSVLTRFRQVSSQWKAILW